MHFFKNVTARFTHYCLQVYAKIVEGYQTLCKSMVIINQKSVLFLTQVDIEISRS